MLRSTTLICIIWLLGWAYNVHPPVRRSDDCILFNSIGCNYCYWLPVKHLRDNMKSFIALEISLLFHPWSENTVRLKCAWPKLSSGSILWPGKFCKLLITKFFEIQLNMCEDGIWISVLLHVLYTLRECWNHRVPVSTLLCLNANFVWNLSRYCLGKF